ncbi:hypothetical protein DS742_27485 [Lacrimispora amygdalina]|uniref:Uncharacterized protein n=1 Tax=Lacrimispora amygdalina TaxID=253257 RepID=A0A3E2N3Z7_9FIRM|nr:hypothetical protein [Clostridium indicum]RFZ75719.1 hypothetical protein DS742_27485 [Clostridium indicum]
MHFIEKALKYANKNITLLEAWQVRDHYDLLCSPYHNLAAVSYYNIAKTCVYSENKSLIIESFAKTYYLWGLEGWNDLNQDIERELREEYERQNDGNESYDIWFNKQIQKAKKDLENRWNQ